MIDFNLFGINADAQNVQVVLRTSMIDLRIGQLFIKTHELNNLFNITFGIIKAQENLTVQD